MRIGSQQNLITIQRRVQVGVTGLNEPNFVWQDWRPDVFCEVEVRRGKEQFDPISRQRYSEEVWRFRTRYDEVIGLDTTMRVVHEGLFFDIKSPLPDGQKRIDCVIECTVQDSTLQGAVPLSIAITTAILGGVVGDEYEGFSIDVVGGTAPYVISAESGTLPPGLEIDNGAVAGVPLSAGTFMVAIQVADAVGAIAALPAFPIVIEAP